MTPAEINRAIAQSLNWDWYAVEKAGWYYREGGCGYTSRIEEAGRYTKEQATALIIRGEPMGTVRIPPPNYHGDLNAIQEAVAKKFTSGESLETFAKNLAVVIFGGRPGDLLTYSGAAMLVAATAPQRCKAYLMTIGKWRDE